MDKFKSAHTTKAPKLVKPIMKPKPKYFQKKIKELLTASPVSTSDSRQDKNKENAVKFLTNEAGGKVEDRSSVLHLLKKKKSKTSKKHKKDTKRDTNHSNDISDEHVKLRWIEDTISPLHKAAAVSCPKKDLRSLKSAKYVAEEMQSDSFKTNESKSAKKHKKETVGNITGIKPLKSSKADSPQVSIVLDISNKSKAKTSSDKTKETILPIIRKEGSITDIEQHFKAKKSKKVKSHKNKKKSPVPLEMKDTQNENLLDLNKNAKNIEDSTKQKVDEIGRLHQKKAPTFVCKKSFLSKSEHIKPNPSLKTKKKTKKDKISFKEAKEKINSKEENVDSNRAIQEDEWTSGPLSSNPFILAEKTIFSSKISRKNPKKKRKRKIQLKSASDIDTGSGIDIEDSTELNNSTTSRGVNNVPSHIIEDKESTQKKKAFKKKRKVLLSANTISENLESTAPEIGVLSQSTHPQLEETVTSNGFNVEGIEIDSFESSSPKVDVKTHKKGKGIDGKLSRRVSSPRAATEQDLGKKPKGKKAKKLKEKLESKEEFLETYGGFIVDIEEPKGQSHSSSGEQQLDPAPLVVNVVNGVELPSVPDIFHNPDNIPSPEEGREICSVIEEFIPDVSEAQNTFLKTVAKKNRNLHKKTATRDTSPVLASEYRSKPRKRKFSEERKYPENMNTQKEDSTKTKILSEPLVISAAANTESFQIPSLLDTELNEPCTSSENVADIHSVIQFILGTPKKDSFFDTSVLSNSELKGTNEALENTQEPSSQKEILDENSGTNTLRSENLETNSRSPTRKKKLSESADNRVESTLENECIEVLEDFEEDENSTAKLNVSEPLLVDRMESTLENECIEVLEDFEEDENSTAKLNVSEPLLVEMTDVEVPTIPAILNRLPAEPVCATEELHSNSLIEHFIPTSLQDEHLQENHSATVFSPVNSVTTNKRKKKERNIKQQKQLDKEVDESEEDSIKFYNIPSCSRFLLFMKYPSLLYFKGKLTVSVLSGIIEVLGYVITSEDNSKHVVYSPKGSSLMSLQTCESDENEVVNYASLTEKLTKIGMDVSVTKDILNNLGQRDCLVILEEGSTINLEEFVKRLPPDMHFFDVSNESRKERNPKSCLYQAQKKLECVFELPSSDKSFRRYTKSPQWDALVQKIIRCNMENLQNGPVSTVVCGGKGVGKSTFLRYFVNKCIMEFGKVLWLDFDPGQAEFVMPGCVAAVVIEEPLLGPNFTHLKKAERMVFVGDVNISQCPIQYLESARHVINYCQSHSELKKIPWVANTMGFCKGLGIDLTTSIIRLMNPHKVVQIQSESFKRNFPQALSAEYVASYRSMWRNGPAPGSVTLNYDTHVICTMTDGEVAENTGQWGMEPRRLREAMILSYLSQMVEPPGYSIFDIVPYVTPFHKLTLCICHKPVQYAHMLSAMNGNLVALCRYDGYQALVPNDPELPKVMNHQPVCPCLGFGIVRGIDTQEKNLFLITPISQQDLQQVNCLMMGAIMLPAYLYTTAEIGMGQVPYVSAGPGQPTSKVIRRFFRPLEERPVQRDRQRV